MTQSLVEATSENHAPEGGIYVQENAGDNEADGTKTFTDESETRTLALFAAVLVTLDDENAEKPVATAVSFAQFGGNYYAEAQMLDFLYNKIEEKPYISLGNEGGVLKFTQDIRQYLEFVADEDNSGKSHLKLKADVPTLYKNVENAMTPEQIEDASNKYTEEEKTAFNAKLKEAGSVDLYADGHAVYPYFIQHETTANDNNGKYGIVRNHIYQINLTEIYGPGLTVPDVNFPIINITPTVHTYVAATVNVLSWRVVPNSAVLDWN